MKIGIDASFLRKPGTGIGVVTEQTLRALLRIPESEAHRFVLYTDGMTDVSFLPANRFKIRIFLPFWKRDDVPRRILWERRLAREAMEDGCEVFVSLSQSATSFPVSSGIWHLMVVHDIIPFLFPAYLGKPTNRLHARLIASAISRADSILAVSETTRRDLSLNLGVPERRIAVAYPDCAPRFRKPVTDEEFGRVLDFYGLSRGYIYHGGGLEIRKNTEKLLCAYAELAKERKDLPPLVISGAIHSRKNRLATDVTGLIRKLDLGSRVRLLGFVPEEYLPALYRGASCFVFPSRYEGFGLPILESFSCGVPVVAGRTAGAVPEVAGNAALLVDTEKIPELVSAIGRLLDDGKLRDSLVERGFERVKEFSWSRFAEALLSSVVSGPEGDGGAEEGTDEKTFQS